MRAALLVHIGWLKGGRDYATILGHEAQIFSFFSPTGHQCHGGWREFCRQHGSQFRRDLATIDFLPAPYFGDERMLGVARGLLGPARTHRAVRGGRRHHAPTER